MDESDQFLNDLLKGRVLILLGGLLVRPLAIIVTLTALGFRWTDVWEHTDVCQSLLHVVSDAVVEHKDELRLHLVNDLIETGSRYLHHDTAVGLFDHR